DARRHGATFYAELIGFGMTGNGSPLPAPPEDGDGARRAMVSALRDAQINRDQVQYLNAHATSTPLGDAAETAAIKNAFGDYARKLAVSSTKSMTGHLLGAAGVLEAVFCGLAIRDQVVPPTITLSHPDPALDLHSVPP